MKNLQPLLVQKLSNSSGIPRCCAVEFIQDLVEEKLMESRRKDVAKSTSFTDMKGTKQELLKKEDYKLLSDEFISKYKHMDAPMNQLGSFVYYRTYSRWFLRKKGESTGGRL